MQDGETAGNAANGCEIRNARIRAGLSTAELAERVGRSQSHLRNIENGHRSCPEDLALAIAQALGADPAPFLRAPNEEHR